MTGKSKTRQRKEHDKDAEFQILLSAFKDVDFVELAETALQKSKTQLVEMALEHAATEGRRVERTDVERRADVLVAESDRRNLALVRILNNLGIKQAEETLRRFQQCEILFSTIMGGWRATRRAYGRWYADSSVRMVRRQCPNEVAQYKAALREWREARRRFLATETERSWRWYTHGQDNKNSVAYRSRVDLNRLGGEQWFRTRRMFKYFLHELLPRPAERRRARREMRKAEAAMMSARERLLERMGVPSELY